MFRKMPLRHQGSKVHKVEQYNEINLVNLRVIEFLWLNFNFSLIPKYYDLKSSAVS